VLAVGNDRRVRESQNLKTPRSQTEHKDHEIARTRDDDENIAVGSCQTAKQAMLTPACHFVPLLLPKPETAFQ
jgi:hypothetical protein